MELPDRLIEPKTLVGKKIFLQTSDNWKEGTIYTENNYDYDFIYAIFSNCIGSIPVNSSNIKERGENCFFNDNPNIATIFYHGGRNPFSSNNKPDPEYKVRKKFLHSAIKEDK